MDKRADELSKLKSYTEETDKNLTMILQSLQWDRKHILQHTTMSSCKVDSGHRLLPIKVEEHEHKCLLRNNGYTKEDKFLPEPFYTHSSTLIKLSKEDIAQLIQNAAKSDSTFKKGVGSGDLEPQTLDRLQCAYSADERRVIHDAVVSAAPSCHDLTDLALPSVSEDDQTPKTKSRTEILAELRDMRRRRTKYRVATKSRNYSDVLRDVIKTQMELYNEALGIVETKPDINELNAVINKQTDNECNDDVSSNSTSRHEHRGLTRREKDRDSGRERSERDNNGKDKRRYRHDDIEQSRGYKTNYSSRDGKYDRRNDSGYRQRELTKEIKQEVFSDKNKYTDRSREPRRRDRSRDRNRDRYSRRHGEGHSKDSTTERQEDRSIHGCDDSSDTERARKLIMNIKRELEALDANQDDDTVNKDDKNFSKDGNYGHNINEDSSHEERRSDAGYSRNDRSKERYSKDRTKSHKRHNEKRDRDIEYERDEYRKSKTSRHKSSHRDRSNDDEKKRSRVEDKHKRYYEIYSELDYLRNKNIDDNK